MKLWSIRAVISWLPVALIALGFSYWAEVGIEWSISIVAVAMILHAIMTALDNRDPRRGSQE